MSAVLETLMQSDLLSSVAYVTSAILFVFGLKLMGSPDSAQRGNLLSAGGMLLAVVVTLLSSGLDYKWIAFGVAIGSAIGYVTAVRVQMTAMPEMVALFNGSGGLASLLLGASEYTSHGADPEFQGFTAFVTFLAIIIGGVTFTGSVIAWAKLSEKIDGKPILYPGQQFVNAALLLTALVLGVLFTLDPTRGVLVGASSGGGAMVLSSSIVFLGLVVLSLMLGVMVVIPIGGADMPVAISLLNSYSGLAACAAGYAINNSILIVAGALVGASGIVLTKIMCKAMNRSLGNVLFSGFGSGAGGSGVAVEGEAKAATPEDAYYVLEAASTVVIAPGYGLAVAQAQHAVRELGDILEENGAEVKYAIHPVAGRMPGHMNVLLAEANVPYEQLVEMDGINPHMPNTDVCIVIGANDVVNPAAREDETSPIYGMPIINADAARTVYVLKRSMNTGFAGISNPLFFCENTRMIFGDAKKTVESLIEQFKS
jgi:NAD(P) transhydrogenase subunit beta